MRVSVTPFRRSPGVLDFLRPLALKDSKGVPTGSCTPRTPRTLIQFVWLRASLQVLAHTRLLLPL